MSKSSILDEYVKATGVEFVNTQINDSKSLGTQSEDEYVKSLSEGAMLSDAAFQKFADKQNWNHIRAVMERAETKGCTNKRNDADYINRKNARKAKILELMKELLEDEEDE